MRPEPLLDRFGQEGRRAWDLCRGIDPRPLVPLRVAEPVVERLVLPFAATTLAGLLAGAEICLQRAFARPALRGRAARRAELTGLLQGAPPWEKTIHFREGVGRWEAAAPILRRQLAADHPAAPVEELVLELADLGAEAGQQLGLFPDVRAGRERRLAAAERQLQARGGGGPALSRLVAVAPWHPAPERRVLQVPIDPAGRDAVRPLALPAPVAVREDADGVPLAVRLAQGWQPVARVEERWQVDLWWPPAPLQRTYYRVSGADGRQLTLCRDQRADRWYRQAC